MRRAMSSPGFTSGNPFSPIILTSLTMLTTHPYRGSLSHLLRLDKHPR
jgi:hypothetical protein